MTTYAYSIQDDFPQHCVSSDRLSVEIRESAIVTALDGIDTLGDVCSITFKADLSSGDEALLDALVAAHSGEPLPDIKEIRSSDGKLCVAPDMFPLGILTQFVGVADDIENGVVGGGALLVLEADAVETVSLNAQFLSPFRLAGGAASWQGAVPGDWVGFLIQAPASPAASNPGAGAYSKYPVGGGVNMFVPHPTAQGDWDLDLEAHLNAHVTFTAVVPVPSSAGFFDWDEETGAVTLNALQQGRYNLFDQSLPLHQFVRKVPILGSSADPFTVPAVRPYLVLPQWQIKIELHSATVKALSLSTHLYCGV